MPSVWRLPVMKALLLILQYLPGALNAIAAVHDVLGKDTHPATTTDIVLQSIKAGADAAGGIPEEHVQVVGAITSSVASSLQKILSSVPPAAPAPPANGIYTGQLSTGLASQVPGPAAAPALPLNIHG